MSTRDFSFRVLKVLLEETDEQNMLSAKEISMRAKISKVDTISDNINSINKFFYNNYATEIIRSGVVKGEDNKGKVTKYYLSEKLFNEAEIIFLESILLNSNSQPYKEINDISKKLKCFLSKKQQAELLDDFIITDGSSKTRNRNIYINLEEIKKAISNKENIVFTYNEYDLNKKLVPRIRKDPYIVSPYKVIWSYGNLYLIGWSIPKNTDITFRIDKITNIKNVKSGDYADLPIKESSSKAEGTEDASARVLKAHEYVKLNFDMQEYLKNAVFMHGSREKINVKLRCENKILGDVIDRFENCRLSEDKSNDEYFFADIPGTTYKGMLFWATEFLEACEVLEPVELRRDMRRILGDAIEKYR